MADTPTTAAAERRSVGAGIDFTDPNSPLAPYYLRASHVAAVGLLGLVFLFVNFLPLWHTDIWGHLAFGRWIMSQGRFPATEPFSPLAATENYVPFGWLSQVGLYGIEQFGEWLAGGNELARTSGGVELLRFTFALLVTARSALLLLSLRRVGGSMWLAILGVVLSLSLSMGHLGVFRPQVAGEVCFAGLLAILSRPPRRRDLAAVPMLIALWANLHGSFLVGLAVVGGCLAGRLIESGWRSAEVKHLGWMLGLSVLAAGLLNPSGPWIYVHSLALSGHPNIALLDEWRPTPIGSPAGYALVGSLGLLGLTALLRRRWFTATQTILLAGLGVQAFLHLRMMPWWALIVPWVLTPHLAALLARFSRLLHDSSQLSFRKTIIAVVMALVALAWSGAGSWAVSGEPRNLERTRALHPATPWRLAAQLKDPSRTGPTSLPELGNWLQRTMPGGRFPGTIMASETLGDYLIWSLGPDYQVLYYTHAHLFPSAAWRDLTAIKTGNGKEPLDRLGVTMVIFEVDLFPPLRDSLRSQPERWEIVLDESGSPRKDDKSRLMIAVRAPK